MLPDQVPALRYSFRNDTLYYSGVGDPTQLHPYFNDSTVLNFLESYNKLAFAQLPIKDEKFGPGWAWEDYHWAYAPERSALPLFGNVVKCYNYPEATVQPEYFKDSLTRITFSVNRKQNKNSFFFAADRKDTVSIPFITGDALTQKILEQILEKPIVQTSWPPGNTPQILYGMATDTVLKRMMQESDNFLAEQLLLQASTSLSDTLSGTKVRAYVLDSLLAGLRQPPRWVDGSGLSRYNLFTPESMVHVLNKLYAETPKSRLLNLFATGGETGTIEDWYPGNPTPYIYAKTGTLGNNHCLSGYLITNSGKTLIFSIMNNHFRIPTSRIKEQMQQLLEWVRDTY